MLAFLRLFLEAAGPMVGWTAVFIAAVVAAFVGYIGLAVTVALLHRDDKTRRHARSILRTLLACLFRGGTR